MKTFKHSGELGDIMYSLPVIKYFGGGILFLDPLGGEKEPLVKLQSPDGRTSLCERSINFIKPLLELQDYIKEVRYWNGESVDYNLDNFRQIVSSRDKRSNNLVDNNLQAFNIPFEYSNEDWIKNIKEKKLEKKMVISRSLKRSSNFPFFMRNREMLKNDAVFVGLPLEHQVFEHILKINIEYYKEEDIIDLCSVIKGSEAFIGNSSFILTLAVGMNHPNIIQELDCIERMTMFHNRNMRYV